MNNTVYQTGPLFNSIPPDVFASLPSLLSRPESDGSALILRLGNIDARLHHAHVLAKAQAAQFSRVG